MIYEVNWYKGWEKCFIDSSNKVELSSVWVYFILAEKSQLTKIGKTTNPEYRLGVLKRMNADTLRGILLVNSNLITEEEAHTLFKNNLHHGEWYDFSDKLFIFLNYFIK